MDDDINLIETKTESEPEPESDVEKTKIFKKHVTTNF